MNSLKYPHKPISSLASLAALLSIPQKQLLEVSKSPSCFYKLSNDPVLFKNGERVRDAYSVQIPLKKIQTQIKVRILEKVRFPDYLQGGIKGRDYINNAKLHCGAKILITEDVKNFFPTVDSEIVRKMWQFFFKFTPEIANLLTKLTTYEGFVPQGAETSSHIANIIFWDLEPKLAETLKLRGLTYSRFIDDTNVSSKSRVSPSEVRKIKSEIYSMFRKKGLERNAKKSKIMTKNKAMIVNGLPINSGKPTISKKKRAEIRSLIHNLENQMVDDGFLSRNAYESILGKVSNCQRLHKDQMKPYVQKLESLKKNVTSLILDIS